MDDLKNDLQEEENQRVIRENIVDLDSLVIKQPQDEGQKREG